MVKIFLLSFFAFSIVVSGRYLHVKVSQVGGWKEVVGNDPVLRDSLIFTAAILTAIFAMIAVFG